MAMAAPPAIGQDTLKDIGRTTEGEINAVLSCPHGSLRISRGDPAKVVLLKAEEGSADLPVSVSYVIRSRVGYLEAGLGVEDIEGGTALQRGTWSLGFTDELPLRLDIELGFGSGTFDFTGLQIKDLNISSGAGDMTIDFATPNPIVVENVTIEAGVSSFAGRRLGNANCRQLRFRGGVGAYTLDFSGDVVGETAVDAEVGLGMLTIVVPKETGARVVFDRNWISNLELAPDFSDTGENQFTSENFDQAAGRITFRLDASLANVRIRRP
jgi:hypothetical protein